MTIQSEKLARYTIAVSEEHQASLSQLAKKHKLSQGEVIEVMLDRIANDNGAEEAFAARRHDKIVKRNSKKTLTGKIKSLTPEQIAMIESMTSQP